MGLFDRFKPKEKAQDVSEQQMLRNAYRRGRVADPRPSGKVSLDPYELAYLYRTSRLARRLVDIPARGSAQKPLEFSGENAADYTKLFKDLRIIRHLRSGVTWSMVFPMGAVLMDFDDRRELDQPLRIRSASRLVGLTPYDFRVLKPVDMAAGIDSEMFMLTNLAGGVISNVHRSRLLLFDGEELDAVSRTENYGCGESYLNQMAQAVASAAEGWDNAAYVQQTFAILDYGIQNLDSMLYDDRSRDLVEKKLDFSDYMRSVSRIFARDSKDTLNFRSMNLGGYKDLFEITLERLSIESGIPKNYLLGRSAAGTMSESGRSEREQMTVIIDDVRADKLDPEIPRFLSLLSSVYGLQPTDYKHAPAVPPDPERQAKIRQTNAQTDAINKASGAYGAKTIQQRFKGEYSNDIEIHPDEDLSAVDKLIGDPEATGDE